MTTTTEFKAGQEVRFTASRLGTMRHPHSTWFEEYVATPEDVGWYHERQPEREGMDEFKSWHLIRIEHDGTLYVPVHESQFEVVEK